MSLAWVANAQTQDDNILTYKPIDEQVYVSAFNHFKIDTLCQETILVTFLGKKEKSFYVKRSEISEKLKKWIYQPNTKFVFTGSNNNGYVISISQMNSEELYDKFLTIFTSYQTGKIAVIEIANNQD